MNSLILFVVIVVASVAGQIVNGGFEDNTCISDLWCDYGPGVFCTGWNCDFGTIDIHHNNDAQLNCYDGEFCVDVSGNNEGEISQSFNTVTGDSYTISWYQAGNMNCDPVVKAMYVRVNFINEPNSPFGSSTAPPTPSQRFTFDTTGTSSTNMGWEQQTFTFVAARGISQVVFTSDTPSSCGMVLDDISVVDTSPSATSICADVDPADWTYGQGYYCDGNGFVQCWAAGAAYQDCPLGTSCQCASLVECSNHGTTSPCV